jgi:hypothetical protein
MNRLLILSIGCLLFAGCQTANESGVERWKSRPKSQSERIEDEMAIWRNKVDAKIEEKKAERQKYLSQNPDLKPEIAQAVRDGSLIRGMTQKQVLLSWQEPDDINSSVGAWGRRDQWVYNFGDTSYSLRKAMISPDWFSGRYYLYFSNGVLDSWQRSL